MRFPTSMVALAALAAGACGSSLPPPAERLASSEAAVRSARELGADADPQAALHLRLADEQVARGRELMRRGDNERADLMLQRAKSDAELSIALTREKNAKAAAAQAKPSEPVEKGQ